MDSLRAQDAAAIHQEAEAQDENEDSLSNLSDDDRDFE